MRPMFRRVALVAVGAALGVAYGATLGAGSGAAAEDNCKTVVREMVRPDSALGGHTWATDTFTRTVTVCVVPPAVSAAALVPVTTATFTIKGHDAGTFQTVGTSSPAGNPMLPGLKGSFTGDWAATYTAPFNPAAPTAWPFFDVLGSNADSTTPWVAKLWSQGAEGKLTAWGWTYGTCNEQWKNTDAGSPGDITGKSVASLGKCLDVSYAVKCDGKVDVTIKNTLVAGVKVKINGAEKTLVLGVNTFPGVTTTDGWLDVKFGDKTLLRVRCIKPSVCPSTSTSTTPTPTASVTPSAPVTSSTGPAPTSPGASQSPQPIVIVGNTSPGALAKTGSPVVILGVVGLLMVAAGATAIIVTRRRNRTADDLVAE
jgi:LPXTG-motif cell wall-anchored protein